MCFLKVNIYSFASVWLLLSLVLISVKYCYPLVDLLDLSASLNLGICLCGSLKRMNWTECTKTLGSDL